MNEEYKIVYSSESLDDMRKIYSYIACVLEEPVAAQKQISRIKKEINSLDFMPMRYSTVEWEPWHSMGMRKVVVDKYVVFYIPNDKNMDVTIIRIFYGGRDIQQEFDK